MKYVSKNHGKEAIALTVIIFAIIFLFYAFARTTRTYRTVLDAKYVTGNHIIATDISYRGERIGASAELCSFILFHPYPETKEYHIIVQEGLLFTRRYPDTAYYKPRIHEGQAEKK